jgi:hypothetical protein
MTKNTPTSQVAILLKHLRRTGSISFAEAWDAYGIRSLTRRITDLKERGHVIDAETKFHPITKQRYVRYSLARQVAMRAGA